MRSIVLTLVTVACVLFKGSLSVPVATFISTWANQNVFNAVAQDLIEGAVITLNTNSAHDVFLFPNLNIPAVKSAFDSCTFNANALLIRNAANLQNGGTQYIITVNSNSNNFPAVGVPFGIACSQSSAAHCLNGQKLQFIISDETSSPTLGPSTSPTFVPTESPTTSSPTLSPTFQPSTSPTPSPTRSPLEPIETKLAWDLPGNLVRFQQKAVITETETISFDIVDVNTVVRFPNQEAFDTCNFTGLTPIAPVGGSVVVGDDFIVGETVFFGCDAASLVPGLSTRCDEGQKIAIEVVPRGENVALNWFRPLNQIEVDLFAEPIELLENDVIQFIFNRDGGAPEAHSVLQFLSKAAFDACDFGAGKVIDIAEVGNSLDGITYHDLFAETGEVLWFGCNVQIDVGNGLQSHCSLGQKIIVNIVNEKGVTEPPADEDNNDLAIIIGGAVAAVAVVSVAAVVIVKTMAARNGGAARKNSLNKLGMEPIEKQSPPAKMSVDVVQRPLYQSPKMNRPQGTTSLAKSKAALSGLDF